MSFSDESEIVEDPLVAELTEPDEESFVEAAQEQAANPWTKDDEEVYWAMLAEGEEGGVTGASFKHYLKEIGRTPPLDSEQERALGERILAGDMEARKRLVEANLRWAMKYAARYRDRGVAYRDLLQEACAGMARAAERFDYRKGFRFITYASWWMKKSLQEVIRKQGRPIAAPSHGYALAARVHQQQSTYYKQYGTELPPSEAHAQFGDALQLLEDLSKTEDVLSLDAVSEDTTETLAESIPDPASDYGLELATRREMHEALRASMRVLTERECQVIELLFFDSSPSVENHTLVEVAEVLKVTATRIQQIRDNAFRKLRTSPYAGKLRSFLDEM